MEKKKRSNCHGNGFSLLLHSVNQSTALLCTEKLPRNTITCDSYKEPEINSSEVERKKNCPQKLMIDLSIEVDISRTVWDCSEIVPYE